jgi:hypothetical protein
MARKPGDSRPDNAPEKLAMPDEASVLDYINSCAVPPSLRDITRAFKIGQDQRASMRRMLRDMAERGILAGDRRGIAAPTHCLKSLFLNSPTLTTMVMAWRVRLEMTTKTSLKFASF